MAEIPRRVSGLILLTAMFLTGCSDPVGPSNTCEDQAYPDWQTSDYMLPYPAGARYLVKQGNCTPSSHSGWNSHQESGPWAFSYDFLMPMKDTVVAARGGTVVNVEESFPDANRAAGNAVIIDHGDGTYAGYGHLSQWGSLVEEGELVIQGQPIGLSGMSGNTDGKPHLHFHVGPCPGVGLGPAACRSLPVTFRNTSPNPKGLVRGVTYEALPM